MLVFLRFEAGFPRFPSWKDGYWLFQSSLSPTIGFRVRGSSCSMDEEMATPLPNLKEKRNALIHGNKAREGLVTSIFIISSVKGAGDGSSLSSIGDGETADLLLLGE